MESSTGTEVVGILMMRRVRGYDAEGKGKSESCDYQYFFGLQAPVVRSKS